MKQVNVRLTEESISIIEGYKEKNGIVSFTQALNEVICNSQKMSEEIEQEYLITQKELNEKVLSLLNSCSKPLPSNTTGKASKRISIYGKEYASTKEASLILGIARVTVYQRIARDPSNCFYIEDNKDE